MFFRKKLNRVLHVKEAEERFEKDIEKTPLEKKDRLAMVLAALIVPLEDLPEAMRQLREKTGPIYALYRKAQKRN